MMEMATAVQLTFGGCEQGSGIGVVHLATQAAAVQRKCSHAWVCATAAPLSHAQCALV